MTTPSTVTEQFGNTTYLYFNDDEFEEFVKKAKTKTINWFVATLIPVRTNNWKNFSRDFFLPTVVNHAINVDHIAARIFAVLGALALDLLTLPIRLITAPFRAAFVNKKEDHEAYQFLIKKGVNENRLTTDDVAFTLEWSDSSDDSVVISDNGASVAPIFHHEKRFNLSFIDVPSSYRSNLEEISEMDNSCLDIDDLLFLINDE
ncbi:MAG: hypothetical protein H7A37_06985 [Chlamydiales bacterium]|nr:hypothetical protein [Chlamydiia bacterium]MCP5508027.1 hypothetical protein [Chlamydiales bacterium]